MVLLGELGEKQQNVLCVCFSVGLSFSKGLPAGRVDRLKFASLHFLVVETLAETD